MKRSLFLCIALFSSINALPARWNSPYEDERDFRDDLIRKAPPEDLLEHPTPPPGKEYMWIPGHWIWQNEYKWQSGFWAKPPHPYSRWLHGHWEQTTGGWIWVPGRWT